MSQFGKRTGLLLGAGFSFPSGMPLVRDLSSMLFVRAYERLRDDEDRCLLSDRGLKDYADVIVGRGKATHYEAFVGQLEDQCLAALDGGMAAELTLASAERFGFLELIYDELLDCERQARITGILASPLYRGLGFLAATARPLWVFSLNHDWVLEKLAANLRIPLATPALSVRLPSRLRLLFDLLKSTLGGRRNVSHMASMDLDGHAPDHLLGDGVFGINLVKLHGALNQFIDITDLERPRLVQFSAPPMGWHWDALSNLLSRLGADDPVAAALNHRHVTLGGDRMRWRNTLLSGSHKFAADAGVLHNPVAAPIAVSVKHATGCSIAYHEAADYKTTLGDDFLGSQWRIFQSVLPRLERVVTIGYSLGDAHVNGEIARWLAEDGGRTFEVVGPGSPALGQKLGTDFHAAMASGRVEFTDADTLGYLSRYSDRPNEPGDLREHAASLSALVAVRKDIVERAERLARLLSGRPHPSLEQQVDDYLAHGANYAPEDVQRLIEATQSFPKRPTQGD